MQNAHPSSIMTYHLPSDMKAKLLGQSQWNFTNDVKHESSALDVNWVAKSLQCYYYYYYRWAETSFNKLYEIRNYHKIKSKKRESEVNQNCSTLQEYEGSSLVSAFN